MKKIISTGIVLPIDNIDTDQIIPARFLKATSRDGFGEHLFHHWRYRPNGSPNPDFALARFHRTSEVLIAGNNFGCGSSREHAAWALADYGIRAVVSSQFADIFKGNALNNGILPIEVTPEQLQILTDMVSNDHDTRLEIDLPAQELRSGPHPHTFIRHFEIDPLKKQFLMDGITESEYLLTLREEIAAFAKVQFA